jgi:protein-S-isoprenylcysteine O-methyltransferase Ste14
VVAPGTVAGLVPLLITGGKRPTVAWGAGAGVVGVALAAGGAIVLLDAFRRFALEGRGTPAPVYPTRGLVASGPYWHVRNPMYLAVLAVVLGQALVWARAALLVYAGFLALAFHLFVLAYEEPTLRRRFGDDYARYCRHVPRWRPRRRPWTDRGA